MAFMLVHNWIFVWIQPWGIMCIFDFVTQSCTMYSILFQQQSDIEWKYGLAKLIRNMHRTNASPAPINLVTTWTQYLQHALKRKFTKIRGPKGRGNIILTYTWKPLFVSPSLCDLCTATLLKLGCWNFRQSYPKLVSKWNVFLYR